MQRIAKASCERRVAVDGRELPRVAERWMQLADPRGARLGFVQPSELGQSGGQLQIGDAVSGIGVNGLVGGAGGAYGIAALLAGSARKASLALARDLLNVAAPSDDDTTDEPDDFHPPCPCCGGRMLVIETFARGRQPRGPPGARTTNPENAP